jgi:hypothetical protein
VDVVSPKVSLSPPTVLISSAIKPSPSKTIPMFPLLSVPTSTLLALLLLVVVLSSFECQAFTQQQHSRKSAQRTQLQLGQTTRSSTSLDSSKKKFLDCPCPEESGDDEDDVLEDRREALFAMMGSLWSVGALSTSLLFGSSEPAHAEYGLDAKMTFPDVVQGLSDRNSKQCLVESLGNRECLVYRGDEEKLLYKGANVDVLLGRIQSAAQALEVDIPLLLEKKQWSKITGVLTGVCGQLSSTLTSLANLADDPSDAKQKAQVVKQDMFNMGTATTNKQGDVVLQFQQQAVLDLALFLKSL